MGIWDRLSRTFGELTEELLPSEMRDRVEGARALLERGQAGAAAAALEEVLKDKPDHATASYLLGVARLRTGEFPRAAEAFSRAVETRAGFGEALAGLGEARLAQRDVVGALAAYREALEHAGGDTSLLAAAYRGLGQAHLATGALDKAVRELRKALVEDPSDGDAAAALGEALLSDPSADPDEARGPLERAAAAEEPSAAALVALGRLDVRGGRLEEAERVLKRAMLMELPRHLRLETLLAMADSSLARGDLVEANDRLLRALELAPERSDLHARLGDFHAQARNPEAALAAYGRARELGARDVAPRALEAALAARDLGRAAAFAADVLHAQPEHARALAARGAALAAAGEARGARELLARSLAAAESSFAHAALGRLELTEGVAAPAAQHARAALRLTPGDEEARALLAEAGRAELGAAAPLGDLYALARRVHAATVSAPLLGELAPEALRALESYDRPLLVTVMGEFSSGKSTFVNAFLGAEVAPVGITPTTATINILKYGTRKGGRIVYHDDTVRELGWEEVGRALRALDAAEARRVRHVEVLYPTEALERVNIVDTPGLNSILPEHEETARRFIAQADAVIWLFTVGQAGKATEREALEKIRAEGKRVLGVVNKIDQAGEADVPRILEHVTGELGGLVEALVPVSARHALAARLAGDEAALKASRWAGLEAALEERFFRQARRLKRDACAKRVGAVLGEARGRAAGAAERSLAHVTTLRQAAIRARADATLLVKSILPEERRRIAERTSHTYRTAAREVLELVRPRKLPFGTHTATSADRDYLIGHLERGLTAMLEPTRKRVLDELSRVGGDARGAAEGVGAAEEIEGRMDAALERVDAAVFQAFRSYVRGYVRGGRVDEFFARALPRLALEEDAVYHALVRDAPDLENELHEPLLREGDAALRRLAARLDVLAELADVTRHELEAVLVAGLDAFEAERRALAESA